MDILNLFSRATPTLLRLPSGSLTVNRDGEVICKTLPSTFPDEMVDAIAQCVVQTFRDATAAHLPFTQLVLNFASLRVTAREMRGGAVIFLSPIMPYSQSHN